MPAHVSYKKWHARQKPSPHASMPKIKLQNQLGNLKKLEKLEKSSFFKFFQDGYNLATALVGMRTRFL